jgi:hypothetical protein
LVYLTENPTRKRGYLLDQQVIILLYSILVSSKSLVAESRAPNASPTIM